MRILIYGAGVIGSRYAVLFSKAGYEVSVYARGRRLQELSKQSILSPPKFHLLRLCPQFLLKIGLTMFFRSHFGDVFMYRHAMKSSKEMRQLHRDFYSFMRGNDDENL